MTVERERQRRFRITFRVSASERERLIAAAERAGLCISSFARCTLLDAEPMQADLRPAAKTIVLAQLLARLGGVAASLHQTAKQVNDASSSVRLAPIVERELLHSLSELRPIRYALLRAIGRKEPAQ
jgi:uncharacterized protein (DUF1778 family)